MKEKHSSIADKMLTIGIVLTSLALAVYIVSICLPE